MKYAGKTALYKFLKEHGYDVPKMKNMRYGKNRGNECLEKYGLELFSSACGLICVTLTDENAEGERVVTEYSRYVDGKLVYQKKNGELSFMA